ncbi:phage excisionase [Streptomyces sp. NBRC 110611]|uniref:DUF2637 domain-containing protein n=1 Tax=Streptomyces sp. NBRC 110611 TaxID=1621259 RepID=UPI000836BEE2|nr:DUF2637 domain-containing protein [Streptomyces sp. NBRC 110611]GAU67672.1 phage excisionase [Streptomyces sp. NBRC 110611]
MAYANRTAAGSVPAPPSWLARWAPIFASVLVTGLVAYCAFRLSFEALTALAEAHGVEADVVWMFAALVDGGAVMGTVGVVVARWNGRKTWPYWLTIAGFAATSLGFNVAHSDGTAAGIAIAVTPPVAQLVATELLVRMLPAPETGTVSPVAVVPSVTAAEAAARRAESAARSVADTVTVAVGDATDAARAYAAEASAAAERAAQISAGDTAAAIPVEQLDLAALVAAVDSEPPFTADDTVTSVPGPLPHSATFAAPPPLVAEAAAAGGDAVLLVDGEVPRRWIEAYRRVEQVTGKRPTAERLGAALGLKRTRGGEIRELVEAVLEPACAVMVS